MTSRQTVSSGVEIIGVDLGARSYDVLIGRGARHELAGLIPASARKALVVTQAGIGVTVDPGIETEIVEIPDGERTKSLATVEEICRRAARFGLSRADVFVGVGGGVVTDVAGFAAACWHRGTAVVHVATSLLAQVDAAIGGKTGVNLPEGKNLVGAFWQPSAVICDTETLASLPPAEWRSGHGEMAKYAFLGVDGLESLSLEDQVARCVELKARVVAADEREGGARMNLNYGHTLAHALEAAGFAGESGDVADAGGQVPALRHGEAVAIGLVFAARLAHALGRIDVARVRRHEDVVAAYDLPARVPSGADPERLVSFMARDKKAHGDLTFVLDGPHGVEPVRDVPPSVVAEILRAEKDGAP
jgi:5-deoxy-5-amino-3-dehydroquinate synthase